MIQNIYKFHLIRQTDSMDCGAACLAMIINYGSTVISVS